MADAVLLLSSVAVRVTVFSPRSSQSNADLLKESVRLVSQLSLDPLSILAVVSVPAPLESSVNVYA